MFLNVFTTFETFFEKFDFWSFFDIFAQNCRFWPFWKNRRCFLINRIL